MTREFAGRDTTLVVRRWRRNGLNWRVTVVGGLARLEQLVGPEYRMVRLTLELEAMVDACVEAFAAGIKMQWHMARAEQRAALAAGDHEAAARWGVLVRTAREQNDAMPEPWRNGPCREDWRGAGRANV